MLFFSSLQGFDSSETEEVKYKVLKPLDARLGWIGVVIVKNNAKNLTRRVRRVEP